MPAPRGGFEVLSVLPTRRIVDAAMRRNIRPDLDARRSESNRNNAWASVPTLDLPSGCRVREMASGEVRALASALGKREGGVHVNHQNFYLEK